MELLRTRAEQAELGGKDAGQDVPRVLDRLGLPFSLLPTSPTPSFRVLRESMKSFVAPK